MSIYHLNMSNVSRQAGSSSCATLSYISGVAIHEERTGSNYQYGRAERVVCTGTIIPPGAPPEYQDPEVLFNAIENHETAANARTAKKIEIALPREFDLQTSRDVVEDYIKRNLTSCGYAATYAIHHDKDGNNPHVHILVANRVIGKNGEWGGKRKMIYETDADGNRVPLLDKKTGQQKVDSHGRKQWKRINAEVNPLDEKRTLKDLRKAWADICNERLEAADRIDHRSYADQGVDKIPTQHEGYAARAMAERGQVSEIIERNQQIREINKQLEQIALQRQAVYANLIILEKEQQAEQKKEAEARQRQEEAARAAEEKHQEEGADALEKIKRLFNPDYDKQQKEAEERQQREAAARAAEAQRQQEQRRQAAAEAARAAAEKAAAEQRRQAEAARAAAAEEDRKQEQYWINYLGSMSAQDFDFFLHGRFTFGAEYVRRYNAAADKAADMWIKDHVDQVTDYFKKCVDDEKQKIAPWLKEHPKPYDPEPQQGNRLTRIFVDHWYKTSDGEVYYDKQYDRYRDHQQNLVDRWNCDYMHVGERVQRAEKDLKDVRQYAKAQKYDSIRAMSSGQEHTSLYHMIYAGARDLIQKLAEFAPVRAMIRVVDMIKGQKSQELQRERAQEREQERQRSRGRGYSR